MLTVVYTMLYVGWTAGNAEPRTRASIKVYTILIG